jgi:hypothetical protein
MHLSIVCFSLRWTIVVMALPALTTSSEQMRQRHASCLFYIEDFSTTAKRERETIAKEDESRAETLELAKQSRAKAKTMTDPARQAFWEKQAREYEKLAADMAKTNAWGRKRLAYFEGRVRYYRLAVLQPWVPLLPDPPVPPFEGELPF